MSHSANRITETQPLEENINENQSNNNHNASMMLKNLAEDADQGATEEDEVEEALVETALSEMVNEALR